MVARIGASVGAADAMIKRNLSAGSSRQQRAIRILGKGLRVLQTHGKYMQGLFEDEYLYSTRNLSFACSAVDGAPPMPPDQSAIKWKRKGKPRLRHRLRISYRGYPAFTIEWDDASTVMIRTLESGPWLNKFFRSKI